MERSVWKAVALGVGLLVLVPTAARADTYLVTSCHDPGGQPNAAAGWVPFSTPGGLTSNTCATGGGLNATLVGPQPPGNATANWHFDAPAGTTIVRVAAKRVTAGLAGPPITNPKDISYFMAASGGQVLEDCTPGPDSTCVGELSAPLDKQGLSASFVEFRTLCLNAGGSCSRPLAVAASQMWVTLADPAPPTIANVKVLDDGDVSGTMRVSYDAADVGGGVYRTLIKVDGQIVSSIPLAAAPCADDFPSDADAHQFDVPVPCPASVAGAVASLDVKSLSPGPHGVEIAVEDAAGNQTTVFGPLEFPKLNANVGSGNGGSAGEVTKAQALRGQLRMWFVKARNRGRSYTSTYGNRVVTRGLLLTRSGKGIQGARIDVYHIRNGKRRLLKTGLKSRAKGALTLILPLNVDTRTIEFDYRAVRPGPITSTQRLRLKVLRKGRIFHRT
jgi:hypothetical protein